MDKADFQKFKPADRLLPYVNSYWTGTFNLHQQGPYSQSVIPNGCMEIIIHLSDDHCYLAHHDNWKQSSDFIIQGLYTTPYQVRFRNTVRVFGIRIYPDGFKNIFRVPAREVLSTFETCDDVLGSQFSGFCSRLREIKDKQGQIALADSFLGQQLEENNLIGDYSHIAMTEIRRSMGMGSYQELLENVPIGKRQLQRQFKNSFGITVRDYIRLLRVNAIHEQMANAKDASLTQISYNLNFADQSHFIKEYRKYHNTTPTEFTRQADHYLFNAI